MREVEELEDLGGPLFCAVCRGWGRVNSKAGKGGVTGGGIIKSILFYLHILVGMEERLVSDKAQEAAESAEKAMGDEARLEELVETLAGGSRRARQNAATALAIIAKVAPEKLVEKGNAFVDALNRPEAQTRWECLDVLTMLVDYDSRMCDKAIPGAEAALFDEESGLVRLAAMRFLCKLGGTTENRSERVWSLIDEGIQCWHGDMEFQDMLIGVVDFSAGKLSPRVKEELAARMAFDASNGRGALKRRAQQILDNLTA